MVQSLAVLGTGSDVGKTVITAGICRILNNHGIRVAPFKAQNMSNNAEPALMPSSPSLSSAPLLSSPSSPSRSDKRTEYDDNTNSRGWGEIGTAQAMQAEACRILPRVEMNPILLKSGGRRQSDGAYLCNVIVLGKSLVVEDYGSLGQRSTTLMELVADAHNQLAEITSAQAIVIEGAGSCTELNLMDRDVVNLPLVRKLNCPWILVANIDPGGVFAQVVGTKACVTEDDWDMCVGVVINQLRGDAKYFEPGPAILEEMVGKPIFVVPYLYDLTLPEEDGLGVERRLSKESILDCTPDSHGDEVEVENDGIVPYKVIVIAYPHIAITSDLTPLENDKQFIVEWRREKIPTKSFPEIASIILPGSRLTRSDLEWMKNKTEWIPYLQTFVKKGGRVLGLCGGYQMMGVRVSDPKGVEGEAGVTEGLGFLPIETQIEPAECKIVSPRKGVLFGTDIELHGFELHCGRTWEVEEDKATEQRTQPLIRFTDETTGEICDDGMQCRNLSGTYFHGLLKDGTLRRRLLFPCGHFEEEHHTKNQCDQLDKFAEHLESCGLNFDVLADMMNLG